MRIALFGVALIAAISVFSASPKSQTPSLKSQAPSPQWFKGNLHTHTLNSDGDSTPDDVVKWYREHGYNFVTITDHNYLTSVDGLNAVHGADTKFLVLQGEELTDRYGAKPLHVNGLLVERLLIPPRVAEQTAMVAALRAEGLRVDPSLTPPSGTLVQALQGMVDAIRGANGVPSINHPNFGWAI